MFFEVTVFEYLINVIVMFPNTMESGTLIERLIERINQQNSAGKFRNVFCMSILLLMDFTESLHQFAATLPNMLKNIKTEEATKTGLIMPFLSILGYNVFNPAEVCPECVADVGTKKGEKVDYAIMKDGQPIILIECKSVDTDLSTIHQSQLYRYLL